MGGERSFYLPRYMRTQVRYDAERSKVETTTERDSLRSTLARLVAQGNLEVSDAVWAQMQADKEARTIVDTQMMEQGVLWDEANITIEQNGI